jgi:hypothetical protein
MRFAAQRTIELQDNFPVDGSLYMPDIQDKNGSMLKALREWEKRRGISYSFKGKLIRSNPTPKKVEEKAKPKQQVNRPIKVPREKKPKRTAEEKRKIKNERNRLYREQNREQCRQRAEQWRAKLTPEQKQEAYRKVREWKCARKAATHKQNGVPVS